MAHKILRLPDVIDRVGFSRSTIYAYLANGDFPQPIRIGVRAVGWVDTDIDDWIDAQIGKSRLANNCHDHGEAGRLARGGAK